MFVSNVGELEEARVSVPGALNAFKKSLIGPHEGWAGWVMRLFTLKEKGCTPCHTHPWPHINYVLSGKGVLYTGEKKVMLEEGSIAYVPSDVEHQFSSTDDQNFVFICIVPEEGDK
ncbi:MAG: cupin domain-containing protein [Peptococcaceae bacterium]|nr:cupin domain-containing protein [Peptococcaceae bacterium]